LENARDHPKSGNLIFPFAGMDKGDSPYRTDGLNSRSFHMTQGIDESGIRNTLAAYNAALNGGKTSAVIPLYTDDGVFMPPYSESAVGKAAVKVAYDQVFEELKFNVKFNVSELVQMAPTWAYVRTSSAGTTDHRSTGQTTSEANQELFILKKGDDGEWRIARYSFSPTK
jgi:uncharacterized protein (TIGR02246 family)